MKKFSPMSFGLIEEGRLAKSLDEAIAESGRDLIAHVGKYGPDMTKGAKAEVILKVTFTADLPAEGEYSVKGKIDTKRPGRPCHTTRAIDEVNDDGEVTLFVRASGSDETTPRQGVLATKDGRGVDVTTGAVIDGKKKGD